MLFALIGLAIAGVLAIIYFAFIKKDPGAGVVAPPNSGPNNGPPNSAPPKFPRDARL